MTIRLNPCLTAAMFIMIAAACGAGYQKFNIGTSGIWADIPDGAAAVTVIETGTNTPAYGKFEKGDIIKAVNGKELTGRPGDYIFASDPRRILGEALGEAEVADGKLVFSVERAGNIKDVSIAIPILGPYSRTWPLDCPKSDAIVRQTVTFLQGIQHEDGTLGLPESGGGTENAIAQSMAGLFLLSVEDASSQSSAARAARRLAQAVERKEVSGSNWCKGYMGIFLAEYYLKTGDKSVLKALTIICDRAAETQAAGGWGHGGPVMPGYAEGGLMNPAGIPITTALILSRECGVDVDEGTFVRAVNFLSRFPGHGGSAYGDQRGDGGSSNGKNTMTACALSLLPGDEYRVMSQLMALQTSDTYEALQAGHSGGGFNVIWRGIGTVHVPQEMYSHYRHQMDAIAWFYDLTRLPGGGFYMPGSPPKGGNYSGAGWGTGGIGLAYTAPRQSLRITGGSPTRYSVKKRTPPYTWGGTKEHAFLRTDYCEGGGDNGMTPPEISRAISFSRSGGSRNPSVELSAKMMRHYTPYIRIWAAGNLNKNGNEAAFDEIEKALKDSDARVRRAGFDAISNYVGSWFQMASTANKVPKEVVAERFLPYIVAVLENAKADWWEIDGALWAMSRAGPDAVREHLSTLKKFTKHEEWWLRQSACWAIADGMGKDITAEAALILAECFAAEGHQHLRNNLCRIFQNLTRDDRTSKGVHFDAATQKELTQILIGPFTKTHWADGYVRNSGLSESDPLKVMSLMQNFPSDDFIYIMDDSIALLDSWKDEPFSKQEPGFCEAMVKRSIDIGEEARPLMERIARVYAEKKANRRGFGKVAAGIRKYEEKYGELKKPAPPPPKKAPDMSSLKKGLVGYWQFDEGTGEESADASGRNNKAVFKGGAGWTNGLIGTALQVRKDQQAEVPGYKDQLTDGRIENLSVSYWIRTAHRGDARVGKGKETEFTKVRGNWFVSNFASGAGWDVWCWDSTSVPFFTATFDNKPHTMGAFSDKEADIPGYIWQITDDGKAWHHVVAVYDGSRKTMGLYVDGFKASTESRFNPAGLNGLESEKHIVPAVDDTLTFGGKFTEDKQVESFDEIAIWDRAITDQEVKALYNGGQGAEIK